MVDLTHSALASGPDLKASEFEAICKMIYSICGINISGGKEELVRGRLARRLRKLNLPSYDAYLDYVKKDSTELSEMVDMLTTNKTSFFREIQHFDYLREVLIPQWKSERRPIRIWSAGCSSGEEPYTIAMCIREHFSGGDVQILATDISATILQVARSAQYNREIASSVPAPYHGKYFREISDRKDYFQVSDDVRHLVSIARLNLQSNWPMRGPFEVIFCRNVMIYFDDMTKAKLIQRYASLLSEGGHLLIGHSESLGKDVVPNLQYVRPATYQKVTTSWRSENP